MVRPRAALVALVLAVLASSALPHPVDASTASPNDARRAKLKQGEQRIATGHRAEGEKVLMEIIEDYNNDAIAEGDAEGLAIAARAAHLMRSPKDANTLFNKSERADKKRVETLLWRADLFVEKDDFGHAEEVLKEALALGPKSAEALVRMARVKLGQALDFEGAEALVKEALALDPKNAGAFAVRAGIALRDLNLAASEAAIAAGLASSPNDLELWSLRAATRLLAEDRAGFEAAKREVFARNREYATFYGIVADFAEWEHRYDDIVAMMKEATALDPEDGRAWALLGLTQMRAGDEDGGLAALKTAWQKDHYNVRVFNTLNLYEKSVATQYERVDGPVFRIRYPKDEKKVLERYVPRFLDQAWASMKARYGFTPTTPVQVELYSTREHFSVRTSGLPNIGIQGVCFGRVVAAMSPKSEPFNWGNVLWHELGHVFAIQLSKSRVPRWFTEGLSEYETIARRPEWQRELDPQLFEALENKKLPAAVDMNRAFTHASDGLDVSVAYYASSQLLAFAVEELGMGRVVSALKLWGEGARTADVLPRAFAIPGPELDRRFRAWAGGRLERYKGQFVWSGHGASLETAKSRVAAAPKDAGALADLAMALFREGQKGEAKKALDAALAANPNHPAALYLAAKLAQAGKDGAGFARYAEALQKSGADGYAVQMVLADAAELRKDMPAFRGALEAAHRFDPTQGDPLKGLVDLAIEEKREADAIALLRRLAPLDQHDRRVWRMLLERLVATGAWDEAARVGESALYVDVLSAPVHTLYAKALLALGRKEAAAFEAESATLCEAKPKDGAEAYAIWAKTSLALGKGAEARKQRDKALDLDPTNAEAKNLTVP